MKSNQNLSYLLGPLLERAHFFILIFSIKTNCFAYSQPFCSTSLEIPAAVAVVMVALSLCFRIGFSFCNLFILVRILDYLGINWQCYLQSISLAY